MKGPKALISSAIAQALAEYFVVDVTEIESHLLVDTKIVLNNVELKPITSTVTPENTFGNSTQVHVTGVVKEVVFSWSWSLTGGGKSWVKDAVLTIDGAKFKGEMMQVDSKSPMEKIQDLNDSGFGKSLKNLNDEADTEAAQGIQQAGSIETYLMNQVKMIVDALTLEVVDTEMVLEMPAPIIKEADGSSKQQDYTISLVIGSKKMTLKSLGRQFAEDDDGGVLKEEVEIDEFAIAVVETYHNSGDGADTDGVENANAKDQKPAKKSEEYSLMDPFSYGLQVVRTKGERFSSLTKNLVVKGGQHLAHQQDKGISFHLDRAQLEAFGQLSGLVLAPQEDSTSPMSEDESSQDEKKNGTKKNETVVKKVKRPEVEMTIADVKDVANADDADNADAVSTFELTFATAALDLMGDAIVFNRAVLFYKADGTDFTTKADRFNFFSPASQMTVNMTDISSSIRPSINVHIGSVDNMYIPEVLDLKRPMNDIKVELVGDTWTVNVDTLYGSLPAPDTDEIIKAGESDGKTTEEASKASTFWVASFPFSCKFNKVRIIKGDDQETEITFTKPEILAIPEADQSGTRMAFTFESMENKLMNVKKMDLYALVPADITSYTFQDFALATESVYVTGGYTVQDWISTFRIGGLWELPDESDSSGPVYRIPDAQVAPAKMKITYDAMTVVQVKETTFRVKQFKGNKDTTVPDLVDFYIKQCLRRASNFLQNAEVLGLNVENSVRGAIDAGKRQRHAQEGERANATDLLRGIGYSAVEATQKGQLRRGSTTGRGNVLDWMVGTTDTGLEYVNENKDKLGAATGGATGVIVGTLVGGPVGGVIGGIIGGVTAGTTVRQVDKQMKQRREKHHLHHEAKKSLRKLKPGQLALDGV
ncbi:MAG: hypothetical protein SGARI_000031 [Bacillariaceae sp.]